MIIYELRVLSICIVSLLFMLVNKFTIKPIAVIRSVEFARQVFCNKASCELLITFATMSMCAFHQISA